MADIVHNISKGRVIEFYNRIVTNDPTNSAFIVVLFKVIDTDAVIIDLDDLGLIISGSSTEADFTNYGARKALTDSELAALPSPDDSNDRYEVDAPDQTWTGAGNGTNNNLVKLLITYDNDTAAGTDTNILPCTAHDFVVTTDGSDLTAQFNALGFFRAA